MLLLVITLACNPAGTARREPATVHPSVDVPAITSLSPSSAVAGGPGLTLTVTGSGFANNSKVRWQGSDRTTTYVSATEVRATISAADVATLGTPQVTVFTQGGNGGTSNAVTFTVGNPIPAVTSFTPATGPAGGPTYTLQVNGSSFVAGSTVQWNGVSRQTLFESPTRVSITVPAGDVAAVGAVPVRVVNPAPGGGASPPLSYPIQLQRPVISSASQLVQHPITAQTLTVNGTGFLGTSVVLWNGQARTTAFVSPTQVRVDLPVSDTDSAMTVQVTVRSTLGTSSQTSLPATVEVRSMAPSVSSVRSGSLQIRDGMSSTVEVNGSGFGPASQLYVNDTLMTNASVTSYTVIRVARTWRFGPNTVRVVNPPPGGGTGSHTFDVLAPIVNLSSLSPAVLPAGMQGAPIAVRGNAFVPGALGLVNGSPRQTLYVSRNEVRVVLLQSDLRVPSTLRIQVRNPDPGSMTSAELMLTVVPAG